MIAEKVIPIETILWLINVHRSFFSCHRSRKSKTHAIETYSNSCRSHKFRDNSSESHSQRILPNSFHFVALKTMKNNTQKTDTFDVFKWPWACTWCMCVCYYYDLLLFSVEETKWVDHVTSLHVKSIIQFGSKCPYL